jgi:Cd2+/Zn2+-exporting ATPase/Cu+-exporting ATPase
MVEEAELNRGEVQRLADRFAGIYLPIVAGIAILTFLVRRDVLAAAAVLVVACSCSFSLATPIAMLASIGAAAKKGLLIKGGKYIERLAAADTVFVDKTGTLTLGEPAVTDVISFGKLDQSELLSFAASVEKYASHPLANAVLKAAKEKRILPQEIIGFEDITGSGIQGEVNGENIQILREGFTLDQKSQRQTEKLKNDGKTLFFILVNGKTEGVIAAEDQLRPEVTEAIKELQSMGIGRIVLLSGDHAEAVRHVAEKLGIEYQAEMMPEEKIEVVRRVQGEGHVVVMVGDGINDAPALAQADVGIAMGVKGSDIAIEAAHITLLRDDWSLVPLAFHTAKRTMRVVRSNILFTALYNLFGLGLAAFGILPPVFAAALQSLPDIGILANSARLIRSK